jgi:4-amino-4-deoxy-L-arabinose transferase-like glycosyltransferase
VRRHYAAPAGTRWAIATGALIGLGLLTKLALAIFLPLALAVTLTTSERRGLNTVLLLTTASLVVAPWLVHQVTTYGWLDPLATSRHAQVVADQPRFRGLTPEYVGTFLKVTFQSFWAQFGWMAIPAPDRLYLIWGVSTVVGVIGLFKAARPSRGWMLIGATVVITLVAYVAYNSSFLQLQGRYLFIALAPICALLVRGWSGWLPGRVQVPGGLAVGVALVLLNIYTLTRVLMPGFSPG